LQAELERQSNQVVQIPCVIDGQEVYTETTVPQVMPHAHGHILAEVHLAGPEEVRAAAAASIAAQVAWIEMGLEARSEIFLRAADLLAGEWRMRINAATMLNQSKTCFQAEVDSACELIDFWRFNPYYAADFHSQLQPPISSDSILNSSEVRPLEGFVLAITPFNFTSIAGNLPTAPALMGCTVIWKPSRNSYLSNYFVMQLLMQAGLPPGVVNFLPSKPAMLVEQLLQNRDFAGLHFTGSTNVFQRLWSDVATALPHLRSYPRIVGETGGKDFVVAHPECDEQGLLTALIRGSFEYQGQKCSAASRAYIPASVWGRIKEPLIAEIKQIKMGDPRDFTNFMSAVIDQKAFDKISGYIDYANQDSQCEIIVGGSSDDSVGWFIEPTIIQTSDPQTRTMVEEIFGPVLTVYVYEDSGFEDVLTLCDECSSYALTGSIFATNEADVQTAFDALRFTAGNFYINDKPTGAVVGQQPFGGARASGTNDKAGSPLNLLRWVSPRSVKRNLAPDQDWRYPFLEPED
jgi:1-pyrroline-5-carboxylate dehydrogenase